MKHHISEWVREGGRRGARTPLYAPPHPYLSLLHGHGNYQIHDKKTDRGRYLCCGVEGERAVGWKRIGYGKGGETTVGG